MGTVSPTEEESKQEGNDRVGQGGVLTYVDSGGDGIGVPGRTGREGVSGRGEHKLSLLSVVS